MSRLEMISRLNSGYNPELNFSGKAHSRRWRQMILPVAAMVTLGIAPLKSQGNDEFVKNGEFNSVSPKSETVQVDQAKSEQMNNVDMEVKSKLFSKKITGLFDGKNVDIKANVDIFDQKIYIDFKNEDIKEKAVLKYKMDGNVIKVKGTFQGKEVDLTINNNKEDKEKIITGTYMGEPLNLKIEDDKTATGSFKDREIKINIEEKRISGNISQDRGNG